MINNQKDINNNTTIKIMNINRNLNSEKIYVILKDKIFPNKRMFNAIYTVRKPGKFKNTGVCYINLIEKNSVINILDNINYFNMKIKNCQLFWASIQGEEFIKNMNEKKKKDISVDYIRFS